MSTLDFIVVIVYILIIFSIAFYIKGRISSFDDFMIADSKMGVALGVASMGGTELGLITVMYNAQQGWIGHFASFHIGFIACIVTLTVGLSGFVIEKLRKLNVKSIPEFYNLRYDKNIRVLGAVFLVLGGILNMGLFLKVGAVFLQSILGDIDLNLSMIMIVLLALVLFYTMMGGMLSVIITDYIQFVVLSLGLLLSVFFSILTIGWDNIFNYFSKESSFNPTLNTNFGYDYIIWMIILGFVSCVIWPTATTRALAMKDHNAVKKQYIWSSVSFLIRFIVPSFLGICAFVYFYGEGHSLGGMPSFLREILPVGVLGFVVAGMLSAFMSTHDSYLLCWSTIIVNDVVSPLCPDMNSDKKIFLSRIIIVLLGIYILYWGIFYKGGGNIWGYLAITGSIYFSGAISLVVCGLYSKKVNVYGAYCSLFCGLFSLLGLAPIKDYLGIGLSQSSIGLGVLLISLIMMFLGSSLGNILFKKEKKI